MNLKQRKKLYYDKQFAKFRGFTAFAFKNDNKYNYDKLDIYINKEINNTTHNRHDNCKQALAHFMAIHHGVNGDDISSIMKTQLREYLFNSNTYIDNPVQALVDAYHNVEMNVCKTISANSECNCSSISLLILNNKIYIANTSNAKCVVSCNNTNESMPYYNVTRVSNNNYINNNTSYISFTDLTPTNTTPSNYKCSIKPSVVPLLSYNSHNKTHFTLTPDITEVTISNNVYFFIVINDCLAKMFSNKQLMLIAYQTMLMSLDSGVTFQQMCYNIIDAICIEVIKRECNDTLSVLFLPLKQFVTLYNKDNRNDIQCMITRIQNESELYEKIYPQCVVHDNTTVNGVNSMFGHIKQTNSRVSTLQTNVNSPFLDERERGNKEQQCYKRYEGEKIFEKYVKNSGDKGDNKKEGERKKNKKKALFCGCFA